MNYSLPLALLLLAAVPAHAQERTAGGPLAAQASWSALETMIQKTDGNMTILRTDVDAIQTCSKQGMIHAPGQTGATPQGCLDVSGVHHFEILTIPGELNCTQRVALANTYVKHKNTTDYIGVAYSGTIIGKDGNWIMQSGDGDCSPMSNKARWPIMVPKDKNNKPIKNFFKVVTP